MSFPPEELERLRIVLALAVLKSKPVNMTCFAYIQSLRTSFPRPSQSQHDGDADDSGSEMKWKEHASKLEKECETLKQTLEAMEIKAFLANNQAKDAAREVAPITTETPSTAPANQKKGKQKQVSAPTPEENIRPSQVSFDLKSVLKNIEKASKKSTADARLFEVLDTFFGLSALHGRFNFPESAFISTTRRAIDAISVSLDRIIKHDMSLERIQTLDSLLRLVIEKSLPIITEASDASWKAMASFSGTGNDDSAHPLVAFLDQLSTTVLAPILRSFFMLSERLLVNVLLGKEHKGHRSKISADDQRNGPEHADGRPALLAFFHSTLSATCTTVSSIAQAQVGSKIPAKASAKTREKARTRKALAKNSLMELSLLHHTLMFEAIRLLDRMFLENTAKKTTNADTQNIDGHGSKASRVLRFVIKDTVWYLCSVIHAVINAEIGVARLLESEGFGTQCVGSSLYNSGSADLAMARLCGLKKTVLEGFLGLVKLQDRQHHESSTARWAMTSDMHSAAGYPGGGGGGECIDNKLHGAPPLMLDKDRNQSGDVMDGAGNMQDFGSGVSSSYRENNRGLGRRDGDVANAAAAGSGSGFGIDSIPVFTRTPVLLDDMERRMILRVVESFFNIT